MEVDDDAIESYPALWVGFYCFSGAVSRRCFDLFVDFQFAVGIGDPILFSVGGLQLIVEIVRLWLKTGSGFKVTHCVRNLSAIQAVSFPTDIVRWRSLDAWR